MVIRNWHFLPMRFLFYNWLLNFSTSLSRINPLEDSISRSEIKSQYGRDELTGLYDRREMEKALQNRYQQTLRNSIPFYILFVDVDQIGLVNDNYGHLEGDMELCSVASVLSEVVGDNGTVARTGGDEFMVCFRNADEEAVKQIMKDIQDKIDAYNDEMFKPYEMSVSMGYAGCSGQENMIFYVQKATEMAERSKQTKKRLNER